MLKQKIQDDLKNSMMAKDALKTSVLRLLKSAIGYYEIQKGGAGYEASDEDVLTVLNKEVKQRRDSIEQYKAAQRNDLSEKEEAELKILQEYLPEQMNEDDVRKLVTDAVSESGAVSVQDMGKVMAILMPKVKGKADGGMVSRLVKEKLLEK